MESHDGILYVTVQELTDASKGAPVMSYENYRKLVTRRRIEQGRQGKGLGSCALVVYSSLPARFKERYVEKYGDPHQQLAKARNLFTHIAAQNAHIAQTIQPISSEI